MRCEPHPIGAAAHAKAGDGLVHVEGKARGMFGVIRAFHKRYET